IPSTPGCGAFAAVPGGVPESQGAAGLDGESGGGAVAGGNGRRSDGRLATPPVQEKTREQREDSRKRIVAEFAAPELFLRMADLDQLRAVCAALAVGLARSDFTGTGFVFPAERGGNSGNGSASSAKPRRGIPQVSENDERICAVEKASGDGGKVMAMR